MTRQPVGIAVLASVACVTLVARARAEYYMWPGVTAEQAQQVVRQFEGDPDLQFTGEPYSEVSDDEFGPSHFVGSRAWVLAAGTREYRVSAYDPSWLWMWDAQIVDEPEAFYGQPYDEDVLIGQMMPWQQAEPIAESFAAQHYPHMGEVNMRSKDINPDSPIEGSGFVTDYDFFFGAVLPSGIRQPMRCFVSVDSVMGRIVGYGQSYFPVLVDTVPSITGEEAGMAALNALIAHEGYIGGTPELAIIGPDELGLERLAWWVSVWGYENLTPEMYESRFVVAVDAHTGDIVHWERVAGGTGRAGRGPLEPSPQGRPTARLVAIRNGAALRTSYPPIVLSQRLYLYLLNLPGLGAEMELLSPGRATLKTAKATGYVDAKRGILTLNDRPFLRYGKPLIVRGRTYVPLDFVRRLLGDVSLTVRRAPPF
jgi:hypothetical protein